MGGCGGGSGLGVHRLSSTVGGPLLPIVTDPLRQRTGKTGAGMTDMAAAKLTRKELTELVRAEFPEMFNSESGYAIEKVWHGGAVVRRHFDRGSLRPGGTLSGATMMALADFAVYVAVLAA